LLPELASPCRWGAAVEVGKTGAADICAGQVFYPLGGEVEETRKVVELVDLGDRVLLVSELEAGEHLVVDAYY
jgi:hypothetical protein